MAMTGVTSEPNRLEFHTWVAFDPAAPYIGFHLQLRQSTVATDKRWTRLDLLTWMDTEGYKQTREYEEWPEPKPTFYPFTINMPCGQTITFARREDVPLVDLPCPCGNPNHWLVKWSEEPGREPNRV